jgi:hypothetical protein
MIYATRRALASDKRGVGAEEPRRGSRAATRLSPRYGLPPPPPTHCKPDEVRITRSGDAAIIEYGDPNIPTTHFTVGAEKLATIMRIEIVPDDELHLRPKRRVRIPNKNRRSFIHRRA